MICKFCNSEMRLDDCDFNFPGNKDNYWICDCCHAYAYQKIRYGKSLTVRFEQEEDDD